MRVVEGLMESRSIRVLRDTGCNTMVVKSELVPAEKLTGTLAPVFLLDRTARYLPEAIISKFHILVGKHWQNV